MRRLARKPAVVAATIVSSLGCASPPAVAPSSTTATASRSLSASAQENAPDGEQGLRASNDPGIEHALPLLHLRIRIAAPSTPREARGAAAIGTIGYAITGREISLVVREATSTSLASADGALAEASSMARVSGASEPSDTSSRALSDGWIVTYTIQEENGATYHAMGRRTVGATDVVCECRAITPAQRDGAVRACMSLRPEL